MSLHSKFSSGFKCHLSEPRSPKYNWQAPPDLSSAPFCLPLLPLSFTHMLFQSYWSPCCSLDSISPVQSPRLCSGCLLAVSLLQVSVEVNPIGQAFSSHPFQNGPSLPRTLLLLFILLNFNSTCYMCVCSALCLSAPIGLPHPRAGWNFVLLTAGTSQEGSTQ